MEKARFEAEWIGVMHTNFPNSFPKIYECFKAKGKDTNGEPVENAFVAMHFFDGYKQLKDFVSEYGGPLPADVAKELLQQIVEICVNIHSLPTDTGKKYYHGDFNFKNIMISNNGDHVVVIDPKNNSRNLFMGRNAREAKDMCQVAAHALYLAVGDNKMSLADIKQKHIGVFDFIATCMGDMLGSCKNTQKLRKHLIHKTEEACVAAGNCEWVPPVQPKFKWIDSSKTYRSRRSSQCPNIPPVIRYYEANITIQKIEFILDEARETHFFKEAIEAYEAEYPEDPPKVYPTASGLTRVQAMTALRKFPAIDPLTNGWDVPFRRLHVPFRRLAEPNQPTIDALTGTNPVSYSSVSLLSVGMLLGGLLCFWRLRKRNRPSFRLPRYENEDSL